MQYQKLSNILLILILLLTIGGCVDGGGGISEYQGGNGSGGGEGSSKSITLSWEAPTTNEDGTPLTDLAGYVVYYRGEYAYYEEDIGTATCQDNWGITECTSTIVNLSSGIWCFTVTAYDALINESDYSNEVCIYIT